MARVRLVLVLLSLAAAVPVVAWGQTGPLVTTRYDPALRFRTLSVGRFDIYFHQDEEALVRRLAQIVPEAAADVERRFGMPRGRVGIILVDQTDVSNGWATVVPYNLIEIAAVPPPSHSTIGNTDDWLRLVFTHEYAHVVHLDKSTGLFGAVRRVFGRVPLAYPNLFLPDWQIEGLATYTESALTGAGRVPAADFRTMIDAAASVGRFAPLDRATGAVIDWPGGQSAYLYGAYFHRYLADRFGSNAIRRLADATSTQLPFFGARAYRRLFGVPLGTLWQDFAVSVWKKSAEATPVDASGLVRLTRHGFTVMAPAISPDGRIFYSVANPHGFPALMELRDGTPRRLTGRYFGNRIAVGGSTLVFDQLEVVNEIALVSDLYASTTEGGSVRRLTEGARAADPDLSPDGRTIVCTVQRTGQRILATMPLPAEGERGVPVPLLEDADTEFSSPRWSPDGRSIAAERRRLGGPSEIVVVDVATRAVTTLATSPAGRNMTPAWMPDGSAVMFASDRDGGRFALYTAHVESRELRRLQGTGYSAQWPTISPDGERVLFVGYSADGEDLYTLPLEGARWTPAAAAAAPTATSPSPAPAPSAVAAQPLERAYSPFSTLTPRFWIPYIELDGDETVLGAATGGFDPLGRHTYAVTAGWAVPRNRADVQVDYSYTRWRPALFVSASDDTDTWIDGDLRTRELAAGVLWPTRRVRWTTNVFGAISLSRDDFERASLQGPDRPARRRTAARLGWSVSTAKSFGYSISAEDGMSLSVVSELASGRSGDVTGSGRTIIAEARAYQRTWPRHGVLAARVAVAASRGPLHRDFAAGGSDPQGSPFDVDFDAIGLLRGFEEFHIAGRSAAVTNVDYRVPLAWPQRGLGTWPLFIRAVHGAVFFDAGHAWDGAFRFRDSSQSAGVELSLDTVLGSRIPVTVAAGVAVRHDPRDTRTGAAGFFRIGRAF